MTLITSSEKFTGVAHFKIFGNDDQATIQNITIVCQLLEVVVTGNSNVLRPGHHYQNF